MKERGGQVGIHIFPSSSHSYFPSLPTHLITHSGGGWEGRNDNKLPVGGRGQEGGREEKENGRREEEGEITIKYQMMAI